MAERLTPHDKGQVAERARWSCEYCPSQARFAMQAFSIEHIEPQSLEGKSELDNLALACQGCNNHKYTKTHSHDPVTGDLVLLFHPRRQRWTDHFAWNHDFTLIVGTTPTGRATVDALQLNRKGLVNLRAILYEAGQHPPPEPAEAK
jgi:HNH endonuclease